MASNDKTFMDSNDQYEPLDTLQIKVCSKNGIETTVSGIHIGFMEVRYFVNFKMPPSSKDSDENILSAEEEEWLEYMIFIEEDLHWLLKLPHQRFWSQVVYDENLHRCLESYLSQAPRDYDIGNLDLKPELLSALKRVHRLVFLVFLRMSTYKESKKYHIRPKAFGEILYDNFIFDIPKIMDLCALYGIQNSCILNKMVQNIFSTQPKYTNDLDETSKVILTAFNTVEEKLLNISSKQSISNHCSENDYTTNNRLLHYSDLINYVADISITIYAFLECYLPACQTFYQNGYLSRIPTFYEHLFYTFEKEVAKFKNDENERLFEDIKRKIILSKTSLIKVFRNILNCSCIQNIVDSKMPGEDKKICTSILTENFLEIIAELTSNRSFLCDYNLLYPFEKDLELFSEMGVELDPDRVSYIFCSIHDTGEMSSEVFTSTVFNGARPKTNNQIESNRRPAQNIQDLAAILKPTQSELNSCDDTSFVQCAVNRPNEIALDSLIQSVVDVYQDVGEGFVEICLEYYDYDSEKVIDALLTGNLPDTLRCVDRYQKREPKNVIGQNSHYNSSEGRSIFDNDEFDVHSRSDINFENIHMGKKDKTPSTYQALQNDEESKFIKELTLNYESDEKEYFSQINLYEDEYDDTYDSTMVGLKESFLEDTPDDDDEEENKEEAENAKQSNPQDFCINPEILREKAEQRRQARGNFRQNRGGSRPTDPTHNQQQKDRHKANVGNHNRRKQSDFKRSRGMMNPTR